MMSCALNFAAMIVLGLAGLAALKTERMKLMVGNCLVVVVQEKRGSWLSEVYYMLSYVARNSSQQSC